METIAVVPNKRSQQCYLNTKNYLNRWARAPALALTVIQVNTCDIDRLLFIALIAWSGWERYKRWLETRDEKYLNQDGLTEKEVQKIKEEVYNEVYKKKS